MEAATAVREPATQAFSHALQRNDASTTRRLLEEGHPPDEVFPSGLTPLLVAVGKNANEIIHLLAGAGADVSAAQGEPPFTPLAWACLSGSSRDTARTLIELGAVVDRSALEISLSVARAGLSNSHIDLALAQRRRGALGVILARRDFAALTLSRLGLLAGAPILNVARYSGSQQAGLCRNDVIVAIGGVPVANVDSVVDAMASRNAGDVFVVRIVRATRTIDVQIELQPRAADAPYII
jgi:S1-C subfamily serine protease